jgi:hypothetical protein
MLPSDDPGYPYQAYFLCDPGNAPTFMESTSPVDTPEGCRRVEKDEYDARMAEVQAEREAAEQAQREADAARQKADYDALKALGLPEEMCRRLSGYTGP